MTTYGKSPAGLYLARTLESYGNEYIGRKVGSRVHATNTQVAELWQSFLTGKLSAKTVNHVLSLMRNEVRDSESLFPNLNGDKTPESLIDKLTRNVQIATIKHTLNEVAFRGKWLKKQIQNGHRLNALVGRQFQEKTFKEHRGDSWNQEYIDVKNGTDTILMERSIDRCTRQGKAHTK